MSDDTFTAYYKRDTAAQGSSTVDYEAGGQFPHRLPWKGAEYQLLAVDRSDNSATYEWYGPINSR